MGGLPRQPQDQPRPLGPSAANVSRPRHVHEYVWRPDRWLGSRTGPRRVSQNVRAHDIPAAVSEAWPPCRTGGGVNSATARWGSPGEWCRSPAFDATLSPGDPTAEVVSDPRSALIRRVSTIARDRELAPHALSDGLGERPPSPLWDARIRARVRGSRRPTRRCPSCP